MAIDAETELVWNEQMEATEHDVFKKQALKGTAYVIIFYGVSLALRIVSSIVLTHIFAPEYFGLMTLLTTVLVGLSLFSHIGLGDSVIQNARGDEPIFLNTAWTLQVFRGLGLWAMTAALAWPVALFYHEPRMIVFLPVLGFGCLLAGVSSPSLLSLARHMGVGKLSFLELLSQLVQFVVTLIWALIQPSLWALAGGRIAAELARTVASYFLMRDMRPRFALDPDCTRALLHFGKWILVGTALTFLAQQSDRLILGKLVSVTTLGIYGVAFALSELPRQIIVLFSTRVGYPFLARFASRERKEYRATLLKYRLPVLAVAGLGLIVVICLGDQAILHLYSSRYREAAWMIGILAAGLWHTTLYSTVSPAILALSKAHYNAAQNLVFCISLFVLIPLGFHYYGMLGAVMAVAFGDLPVYFVVLYAAHRERVGTALQDALTTVGFALTLTCALALRVSLGYGLPFHGAR